MTTVGAFIVGLIVGASALYLWCWIGLPVPFMERCEAAEEPERLTE